MKYTLPPEAADYADKRLKKLSRKLPISGAIIRLGVTKPIRVTNGNKYRLQLEVYQDKKRLFQTIDHVPHLFAGIDIVYLKTLLHFRRSKLKSTE